MKPLPTEQDIDILLQIAAQAKIPAGAAKRFVEIVEKMQNLKLHLAELKTKEKENVKEDKVQTEHSKKG